MSSNPLSTNHFEKRDLHVGGIGASSVSGTLAAAVDPLLDASETWMQRLRDLSRDADNFVRDNPWQALGAVALVGMTVGYLLARRN
jgi:ElaB/YqjD/DUF883 family membrane-anchored ribosome-binding protein